MSAAQRVEYYDADWQKVESEREYIETEGIYYHEDVGDYRRHIERKHAPLYLDPLTGLVVFDVATYERWVR